MAGTFKDVWLELDDETGERFKNWLLPNPNNNQQAICAICHWKHFDISEGVGILIKHSNSKMHKRVTKILQEKRKQNTKVCLSTFIFFSLNNYSLER